MSRLGRLLFRLCERLFGKYYEGPDAPRRLGEEVRLFRAYYPGANADAWEAFARQLAANAYCDGFVRGYEWVERDWPGPADDPEVLAELTAHDFSLAENSPRIAALIDTGTDEADPLHGLPMEGRAEALDRLGAMIGTFRVTVDPTIPGGNK